MITKLEIDARLLAEAKQIGGYRTNNAVVVAALREYVRRRQEKVVELFGTIDFDPKYDYKKQRSRR